jgi:hypothetical protein
VREEKAARDGSTKVPQNKEVSIMDMSRSRDKPTHDVDKVRNIRMGDPKIDRALDKVTITCISIVW